MTPTARSMQYLKKRGFIVARVEQRLPIPGMFVTRDAFNFGDLLVAHPLFGILLVQVTITGKLNEREAKAREIPELKIWLRSGGKFILQGWRRGGARGERKLWVLTERELQLDGDRFLSLVLNNTTKFPTMAGSAEVKPVRAHTLALSSSQNSTKTATSIKSSGATALHLRSKSINSSFAPFAGQRQKGKSRTIATETKQTTD